MADIFPANQDQRDLDRWYDAPTADFDPWHDPGDARARENLQVRRYYLGFAVLGGGLIVASLFTLGWLLAFMTGQRALLLTILGWEFPQQTVVVFSTLVGAFLLCGAWPDEGWRRRSGVMLMLFLGDLVLWSVDHATRLGLVDTPFGHDYFRNALGQAIGWWEFALIASLGSRMAAHLGESRAVDLGRAVRSLNLVGAVVWFAYFFIHTDWTTPLWPLRERPLNLEVFYLHLIATFLQATVLVQVTMLTFFAAKTCGRADRARRVEHAADESFVSRSEAGWAELHNDRDRTGR